MLIKYLLYGNDSGITNLQERRYQGSIVSEPEKIPVRILKRIDFYRPEDVNIERQQILAWDLRHHSGGVVIEVLVCKLVTEPQAHIQVCEYLEVAAVDHRALLSLVDGVVEAENVGADEGIVAFDDEGQLPDLAVVGDGVVDVEERLFVFFVGEDFDFFVRYFSVSDVFRDMLSCFVWRSVVDVHDVIVRIVLHEDRVEVPDVYFGLYVLV